MNVNSLVCWLQQSLAECTFRPKLSARVAVSMESKSTRIAMTGPAVIDLKSSPMTEGGHSVHAGKISHPVCVCLLVFLLTFQSSMKKMRL
jgi:hypothetical protein